MSCLSVLVTGGAPWATLPIYLDTDKDTRPSIDDSSNEMFSETWTDEIVYDLSFPLTDKNYRVLNSLASGGAFDLKPKELDVTMIYNTNVMSQDKMKASVNGFHKDGRFYVVVYNSQSFARKSKELLLKDIELNQDVFHNDITNNAINTWGKAYIDGSFMYRYPLESMYKTLPNDWYLDCDYQRPWIYLLPLLRKGFLQLGYSFKSPFLESPLGRRILCYLLADDYNEYFGKKNESYNPYSFLFTAGLFPVPYISNEPTKEDPSIKVDKNGFYYLWFDQVKKINTYSNNARVNLSFNIEFLGTIDNPIFATSDVEITIKIFLGEKEVESSVVTMKDRLVDLESEYSYFGTFNTNRQNPLSIRYKVNKKRRIQIRSDLKIEVVKQMIPNLSQYPLNKILNKTTVFDLLRGTAQLFSGYLDVDATGRVLTLYTPYDTKVYDYDFEGYFKYENRILDKLARTGSEISIPNEEAFKYVELGFKPLVEEEEQRVEGKKKASIYGTFLDMGNDLSPNTLNLVNTYFEPTKNQSFGIGSEYKKGTVITKETIMPLVVGTNDGTIENVGNRIMIAYGFDNFERVGDENSPKQRFPRVRTSRLETLFNAFAAYQKIPQEYVIPSNYEVFDLTYDSELPSLYELIRVWIIANNFKQIARVDVMFTPLDFLNFNKRYGYSFYKKDTWVTGTFISMTDYKPCEDSVVTLELGITDPLTYKPVKLQEIDAKVGVEKDGEFDFLIVKNECDYDIEESNPNDVEVLAYYWHYTDETELDARLLPLESPSVIAPLRDFYVVAILRVIDITYTLVKEQKVCPELEPINIVEEVELGYRLTILNMDSEIDTISYTLTEKILDEEDVVTTYDGNYDSRPIRPTDLILEACFSNIIVTRKCGCGTEEFEDICWVPTIDCEDIQISLDIVNEDRTYKPIRVDNLTCCVAQDMIFYKTKLDDPWELLRLEETVYANEVWFKRVVIFNNDICATKVFEIKASEDVFS